LCISLRDQVLELPRYQPSIAISPAVLPDSMRACASRIVLAQIGESRSSE
jgi:hypothetical protein